MRPQVYANDLNPDSFHFLKINIQLNKVCSWHVLHYATQMVWYLLLRGCSNRQVGSSVRSYNLDGRKFIKDMAALRTGEVTGDTRTHPVICFVPCS